MALDMEALLSSSAAAAAAAVTPTTTIPTVFSKPPTNSRPKIFPLTLSFSTKITPHNLQFPISTFSSSVSGAVRAEISSTLASSTVPFGKNGNRHWMVLVEPPPQQLTTKFQIIDYYVCKLESVLGSETDAQMCIYDASCDTRFGFSCDIGEKSAHALASLPGVLSVKPDPDLDSIQEDYSSSNFELITESNSPFLGSTLLFPAGTTKCWLVRMDRPAIGAIRKSQVVDYYVQVLMRILRNEKDAQMCIYHISWESNYGFCCELDDECARELAAVPGVLSVEQDENFGPDDKGYGGLAIINSFPDFVYGIRFGENSRASVDSSATSSTSNIKTKKLFVTGLSFYTSEKTLCSAFEGFGEIVEVQIIMDKISKRSKGYAFVEYTTEEAASTALRDMNGKIINGWMITVDVAKKNPPKYSRGQARPTTS